MMSSKKYLNNLVLLCRKKNLLRQFTCSQSKRLSEFTAEIEGRLVKAEVWKNSARQVFNFRER
jgi:hypothetical protein